MTDHPFEDIAGYALGTLDSEEIRAVEQHLVSCRECQAEAARLGGVVENLGLSTEPVAAPARARARLLASITAAPPTKAIRKSPGIWRTPATILAIAASLVAVISGSALFATYQSLNKMNTELAGIRQQMNDQAAALQVLSSANSKLAVLPASNEVPMAGAKIVFDPAGHRALMGVSSFPALTPDKTYQVWLWKGTERISCATFTVDQAGTQTISIWAKDDLRSYDGMGVTVEPKGGSAWPTGQRIVGGQF